jgi:hypothetical protein
MEPAQAFENHAHFWQWSQETTKIAMADTTMSLPVNYKLFAGR